MTGPSYGLFTGVLWPSLAVSQKTKSLKAKLKFFLRRVTTPPYLKIDSSYKRGRPPITPYSPTQDHPTKTLKMFLALLLPLTYSLPASPNFLDDDCGHDLDCEAQGNGLWPDPYNCISWK